MHKSIQHGHWWWLEEVVGKHVFIEHVWLLAENLNLLHKGVVDHHYAKSGRVDF